MNILEDWASAASTSFVQSAGDSEPRALVKCAAISGLRSGRGSCVNFGGDKKLAETDQGNAGVVSQGNHRGRMAPERKSRLNGHDEGKWVVRLLAGFGAEGCEGYQHCGAR